MTIAKQLVQGLIISLLIVCVPAAGNTDFLGSPQAWTIVIMGVLASVLQPDYQPIAMINKAQDHKTGFYILWSVYITQLGMIIESAYMRHPESLQWDLLTSIALLVMILGLSLRSWSVTTLGKLFTMHLSIQKNHTLIKRGPYRIVRHPSYLGALLLYAASTVFLHAWCSLLVSIVILPIVFLRRIHYEERLLIDTFGCAYECYSTQVKKIIPWIL